MNRKNSLLLILCLFLSIGITYGQEKAPLKTFQFEISINKLKTEQQASDIKTEVSKLPGVNDCQLVLIEYMLKFTCTNHNMNDYLIIDRVKAIVIENGAEIVKINRSEK